MDNFEHSVHEEIRLIGWGWSNAEGLVSLFNKHGMSISIGVDCNSLNAHLLACLDDSAGDFTAVSDQNAVESLRVRL